MAKKKKAKQQEGAQPDLLWGKVKSSQLVAFTYGRSDWYLGLDHISSERSVSSPWVKYIAGEIIDGNYLMHQAQLSVAICAWDGKIRKLDGQHLSLARKHLGKDAIIDPRTGKELEVRLTRYEVKTPESYRTLYIHIQQRRRRTKGHIRKTITDGVEEWQNYKSKTREQLLGGFEYWVTPEKDTGVTPVPVPPDAYLRLIRKDQTLSSTAIHILEILQEARATSPDLVTMPVVGSMWECITSRYETRAIEFFTEVIDMVFGGRGDPARTYYDWVVRWRLQDKSKKRAEHRYALDWYNAALQAFNAARLGKTLQRISRPKTPGRLHISQYEWSKSKPPNGDKDKK